MVNIYDYLKELTKIDVEFIDPANSKTYVLKSYIKRADDNAILIEPPTINGIVISLNKGQYIKLHLKTNEGVFSGMSSVVGKELSEISGLIIAYPTNVKFNQRREYIRVPLKLPIDLIIIEDNITTEENVINIITEDISGTGFAYISEKPLDKYYSIRCKIYLNDGNNNPIESSCDHIYSNKHVTPSLSMKYKNALMFVEMSKQDNDRIIKSVFQYQLEQRRKGLT